MKELSIEEKAKAYDEVRKKIAIRFGSNVADEIFSQFEMSEDERIRKELIEYFRWNVKQILNDFSNKECIAWLEKQSDANKEYWRGYREGKQEILDKYAELEKQGEQKPADKVKPKFREGDWVIDKQGIVHQISNVIENVTNHTYGYDIVDGGYFNDNTEGVRLWTIQDAKDGDVLASKDGLSILIFRNLDTSTSFSSYYNIQGKGELGWSNECFIPATKEQRDLLFQKMKEAGYEWNEKEKRLIEVPKTKEETGVLKQLIDDEKSAFEPDVLIEESYQHQADDLIAMVIEKPAWSEEDESRITTICTYLQDYARLSGSESRTIRINEYCDWLKSLRPQNRWKPSGFHLECIEDAIAMYQERGINAIGLKEILEELKKLREK